MAGFIMISADIESFESFRSTRSSTDVDPCRLPQASAECRITR